MSSIYAAREGSVYAALHFFSDTYYQSEPMIRNSSNHHMFVDLSLD